MPVYIEADTINGIVEADWNAPSPGSEYFTSEDDFAEHLATLKDGEIIGTLIHERHPVFGRLVNEYGIHH